MSVFHVAHIFVMALAFGLSTVDQAGADWQYTQWGMTKAEVVEASDGQVVAHKVEHREQWGIYPDLAAPSRFLKLKYRAYFYFGDESGELTAVRLDPIQGVWCPDVVKELRSRHGNDQELINGYFVWRDQATNSKISLSGFSTCRIRYEPLE